MGTVQLKLPTWIFSKLDKQGSDWLILEKKVEEDTTIGDLLSDIAVSHADFRRMIFNPEAGTINDQVMVFLNDRLLNFPDATETKVGDGDSIMLLPIFDGG